MNNELICTLLHAMAKRDPSCPLGQAVMIAKREAEKLEETNPLLMNHILIKKVNIHWEGFGTFFYPPK